MASILRMVRTFHMFVHCGKLPDVDALELKHGVDFCGVVYLPTFHDPKRPPLGFRSQSLASTVDIRAPLSLLRAWSLDSSQYTNGWGMPPHPLHRTIPQASSHEERVGTS